MHKDWPSPSLLSLCLALPVRDPCQLPWDSRTASPSSGLPWGARAKPQRQLRERWLRRKLFMSVAFRSVVQSVRHTER